MGSFIQKMGNNYGSIQLNGNNYNYLDGKKFIKELFKFDIPKYHWELVIGGLVGSMGGGKSKDLDLYNLLLRKFYGNDLTSIKTNDINYAIDKLNENIADRTKVLMLVVDDALQTGFDSRRSMSNENVVMSETLTMLRHKLSNESEDNIPDERVQNGICFLFFAIQSPTRLDKIIRENLTFTAYKNYYPELDKQLNQEHIDIIKEITNQSFVYHNLSYREYSLIITRTNDVSIFRFPLVESDFKYMIKPPENYDELIELIIENFDLSIAKTTQIKGFLRIHCDENDISIIPARMNEIIQIASFKQLEEKKEMDNSFENIEKKGKFNDNYDFILQNLITEFDIKETDKIELKGFIKDFCNTNYISYRNKNIIDIIEVAIFKQSKKRINAIDYSLIHTLRKKQISFYLMEKIFNVNQGTLYCGYKRYCEKEKRTPILSKDFMDNLGLSIENQ